MLKELPGNVDELRVFFVRLFARPHTYGWSELEPLHTGGSNKLVWFVAPTTVVVRDEDGNEQRAPYRVSGVLEFADDTRWLFRLFNGSEPVTAVEHFAAESLEGHS